MSHFQDLLLKMFPHNQPQPPKETVMANAVWTAVFQEALAALPTLIQFAEQASPDAGTGAQKKAAVVAALGQVVPAIAPVIAAGGDGATKVHSYISAFVSIANALGGFFSKPTPIAQPIPAAPSVFDPSRPIPQ